jgi:hypothetical protein
MSICCCGGRSGTGAGFLRVLRFPLPILIPPIAHLSSGAGAIGKLVADEPSGPSLTPPHTTAFWCRLIGFNNAVTEDVFPRRTGTVVT